MFPLATLTKPEVRCLAKVMNLYNQNRRDSYRICFLGKLKFHEFVKNNAGIWPGVFVEFNEKHVIGYHGGIGLYTCGLRSGLKLSRGPWFVSRKNAIDNTVHVSLLYPKTSKNRTRLFCTSFDWLSNILPITARIKAKLRHGPRCYNCRLEIKQNGIAEVEVEKIGLWPTPGQYVVFY